MYIPFQTCHSAAQPAWDATAAYTVEECILLQGKVWELLHADGQPDVNCLSTPWRLLCLLRLAQSLESE